MRKIQFVMMVLLMAMAGSAQMYAQTGRSVDNSSNNGKKTPTNDPIYLILLGECEEDFPRSVSVPFEAYIQDGVLTVGSLTDLSDVTVAVYNGNVAMYMQTCDMYFMGTTAIPVSSYPAGTYTLLLTTPRGTYVYATFQL